MYDRAYTIWQEIQRQWVFQFQEQHHVGAKLTRNQYGSQFKFDDGSKLTISRRRADDTNDVKAYRADGFCVAVMAKRLAIENK